MNPEYTSCSQLIYNAMSKRIAIYELMEDLLIYNGLQEMLEHILSASATR